MPNEIKNAPDDMHCLLCGEGLPLFRRMAQSRFCSDKHEEKYRLEMGQIAALRLQIAGFRLRTLRCKRAGA